MIMLFAAANGGRSPWRKADATHFEDRPQTTRSRTIEIGRPEQPDLGELKTPL